MAMGNNEIDEPEIVARLPIWWEYAGFLLFVGAGFFVA